MINNSVKESSSYKIFVGGLDPETTEEDLTEYFSKFGKVVERLIKVDLKTKRSRGFAFIGFKSPEAIDKVLEIEVHRLNGKKIDCKRAMTKEDAYSLNKDLKDSCRKVYISNIPKELSRKDLLDLFSTYGNISDFNLIFKKKDTGFLYIIFENEEEAVGLIDKKFVELNGYVLEIKKAIPKESKDSVEEDSKGKGNTTHYTTQIPIHRNSYESPTSYPSMYSDTITPVVNSNHDQNHLDYNYYDSSGQSHHIMSSRMHDSTSPYDRQPIVHHGGPSGMDTRYLSGRIYHYQGGHFPGVNSGMLGHELVPPRKNRVRSEQAINTYNPIFLTPQTGPIYHTNADGRNINIRSRMGVNSFSHAEDQGFGLHPISYPIIRHDHNEHPQVQIPNRGVPSQSSVLKKSQPAHEFHENKIDFSSPRPKESANNQSELKSNFSKKENSPSHEISAPNKITKQSKIKFIEDEIRATKEKLKELEDLLRIELEAVVASTRQKDEEGLSSPPNNEHNE